jgi:cytosine/adenosine deaminase-related metal-dependent hydrolase
MGDGRPPGPAKDLGDAAILPGLVNAHTHLELSWLAGRIRPAASIVDWIRALIIARVSMGEDESARVQAAASAVVLMRRQGTVLVGDVSNSLAHVVALAGAGLPSVVFHELVGFNVGDAGAVVEEAWDRVRRLEDSLHPESPMVFSVVPHAPYSVSPALFGEIARRRREAPLAVHLAESADEIEFLRTGRGAFRRLLEDLGAWTSAWQVPVCDPVEYVERVGCLQPGLLVVHGVYLTDGNVETLRDRGAVVVTCPRSNEWVGAGVPRVSHFYGSGLPVAIGTDSLASAPTLSVFDELAALRRIAPDVAAGTLLESATRVGAEALGFGGIFGTIAPGKSAALVAVDVPAATTDVEEYLVSGVEPDRIRPLSEAVGQ